MVAAMIMGAAIRPRPRVVKAPKAFRDGPIRTRPGISCHKFQIPGLRLRHAPRDDRWSDRRIPRRRNDPVAVAVLFDIAEPGERIVEALYLQLLGNQHVVDPTAGLS